MRLRSEAEGRRTAKRVSAGVGARRRPNGGVQRRLPHARSSVAWPAQPKLPRRAAGRTGAKAGVPMGVTFGGIGLSPRSTGPRDTDSRSRGGDQADGSVGSAYRVCSGVQSVRANETCPVPVPACGTERGGKQRARPYRELAPLYDLMAADPGIQAFYAEFRASIHEAIRAHHVRPRCGCPNLACGRATPPCVVPVGGRHRRGPVERCFALRGASGAGVLGASRPRAPPIDVQADIITATSTP